MIDGQKISIESLEKIQKYITNDDTKEFNDALIFIEQSSEMTLNDKHEYMIHESKQRAIRNNMKQNNESIDQLIKNLISEFYKEMDIEVRNFELAASALICLFTRSVVDIFPLFF